MTPTQPPVTRTPGTCAFVCGIPESRHQTEEHPFEARATGAGDGLTVEALAKALHDGTDHHYNSSGEAAWSTWCAPEHHTEDAALVLSALREPGGPDREARTE